MKMPRDGARVPSFSKKASPKRSTIKCVRHPGLTRRATNQSHNSRARFACHVRSRGAFPFYALLRDLAYSAARSAWPPRRANAFGARTGDDDDLVLDSLHEVLLPSLYHSKAPSLIAERARFVVWLIC